MNPRKTQPGNAKSGSTNDVQAVRYPRPFTKAERAFLENDIKKLGASEELVKLLENRLRDIVRLGAPRARTGDIRDKIQSVSEPLARAIAALEELEKICVDETATLVDHGAYNSIKWTDEGVSMIDTLRPLLAICTEAECMWMEKKGRKQHNYASPKPMWLIARTLGVDRAPNAKLGTAFLNIAQICYQAAGLCRDSGDVDLTRPYRNFMAQRRRAMKSPDLHK